MLKRFGNNVAGLAAIEFAMVIPILLVLFLGGIELSRYMLITQKVDKTAATMSDLIAQATELSTADLDTLLEAVQHVMDPYEFQSRGVVIISSVSREGSAAPTVRWQYTGGGTLSRSSRIGVAGGSATLPNGFALLTNEDVIFSEVFYSFEPMLTTDMGLVDATGIYKVSVSKPRLGALDTLN